MALTLQKHPIQILTPIVLLAAFLLLLFVSLSLPLIKTIYILEIQANLPPDLPITSEATSVRFGLWGYCASGYTFASILPAYTENYLCSPPRVGYKIDSVILELVNDNQIANILLDSVTYVLIIHPIACGLTLLIMIPAMLQMFMPPMPGYVEICTLLISIVPALVTTAVFAVDIVLVVVARQRINALTGGSLFILWGPAVWMTCAAMICLWIGVVGLSAYACGCCGLSDARIELKLRRKYNFVEKSPQETPNQETPMTNDP